MTRTLELTEQEQKAIPSICILAATVDGTQSELEKNEIKRLASRFSTDGFDLNAAYQEAQTGQVSMPKLASQIQSNEGKQLAYEMAVCICSVDNQLSESEKQFLANLHRALDLDVMSSGKFQEAASTFSTPALAVPPLLSSLSSPAAVSGAQAETSELDQVILNRAILSGALELMPQTLATMAIVPVQMQLVYQIGKKHGYDLDLGHTKEFLATVGVGMTSQVVEGYLSGLVRSVTGKFAGKMITRLMTQATESALAFATTYAIGQTAKAYYAGGRTLSTGQLRDVFTNMLSQGRTLKSQYAGQISQQSSKLNVADLLSLGRRA